MATPEMSKEFSADTASSGTLDLQGVKNNFKEELGFKLELSGIDPLSQEEKQRVLRAVDDFLKSLSLEEKNFLKNKYSQNTSSLNKENFESELSFLKSEADIGVNGPTIGPSAEEIVPNSSAHVPEDLSSIINNQSLAPVEPSNNGAGGGGGPPEDQKTIINDLGETILLHTGERVRIGDLVGWGAGVGGVPGQGRIIDTKSWDSVSVDVDGQVVEVPTVDLYLVTNTDNEATGEHKIPPEPTVSQESTPPPPPIEASMPADVSIEAEDDLVNDLEDRGFRLFKNNDQIKFGPGARSFLKALEILKDKNIIVDPCVVNLEDEFGRLRFSKDSSGACLYIQSGSSPEKIADFMEYAPIIYAETRTPVSEEDVANFKKQPQEPSVANLIQVEPEPVFPPVSPTPEQTAPVGEKLNKAVDDLYQFCQSLGLDFTYDAATISDPNTAEDEEKILESLSKIRNALNALSGYSKERIGAVMKGITIDNHPGGQSLMIINGGLFLNIFKITESEIIDFVSRPPSPPPPPPPAPEPTPATPEGGEPTWRNTEEWREMADLRKQCASGEFEASIGNKNSHVLAYIESNQIAYEGKKQAIAEIIKAEIITQFGWGDYEDLLDEQKGAIDQKTREVLFEELVEGEYQRYKEALYTLRTESSSTTWLDKTKEAAKKVLSQNAVQWYLKQNKYKRMVVMAGVVGVGLSIGTLVGGASAGSALATGAGAALYRGARGLGSIVGIAAAHKGEKWLVESIDEKEKSKVEEIERSDDAIEDKGIKLRKVHEEADKERKRSRIFGTALKLWTGAGAGMLTGGLLEGIYPGGGGTSALESKTGKGPIVEQTKVARGTYDPSQRPDYLPKNSKGVPNFQSPVNSLGQKLPYVPPPPSPSLTETPALVSNVERFVMQEPPKVDVGMKTEDLPPMPNQPAVTPPEPPVKISPAESGSVSTTSEVASGIFDKPDVVKMEIASGDSTWGSLSKILEHNDKFKNLSGTTEEIAAKRSFVISNFTNEAVKNAEKIGLGEGGTLRVGDKLDFSEIFADKAKFDEILEKAEKLSPKQIDNIIENDSRIEIYNSAHPNVPLTNDKVSEILNTEVPEVPKPSTMGQEYFGDVKKGMRELVKQEQDLEEMKKEMQKMLQRQEDENLRNIQPNKISGLETATAKPYTMTLSERELKFREIVERMQKIKIATAKEGITVEEITNLQAETRDLRLQLVELAKPPLERPKILVENSQELAQAKERLAVLEKTKAEEALRSMSGDSASAAEVEEGFQKAIDSVYSEKRLLGLRKVAGTNTQEWREIAGLPANKVLEYYKNPENHNNSGGSGLPQKVLKSLATSEKHRNLMTGIDSLRQEIMDKTQDQVNGGVEIKPFDNGESMEQFVKRIGAFRMKLNK